MLRSMRAAITATLLLTLGAEALTPPASRAGGPRPERGRWLDPIEVRGDVDGEEHQGEVLVYLPVTYRTDGSERLPLVIALHGWDHSPALFARRAELAPLADRHGFVVAIPDTGRSIFETRLYPETRGKWRKVPGARWVGEVVLPELRKTLSVSAERRHTAIIGYSTGGRGALLVAARYPELAFAGSVSGTYDLMSLRRGTGEYRIHALIYGSRDRHPERWRRDNGIASEHLDALAGHHLYVAHGDEDRVVPLGQLAILKDALAGVPTASATFEVTPGGGHDWALWNAHWPPMFEAMSRAFQVKMR